MFVQEKINYSGKDYNIAHFANILYSKRLEANKSQQEFALFLGVSPSAYCRHEAGRIKRISAYIVDAMINKFGMTSDELLMPNHTNGTYTALYEWCKRDDAIPYLQDAYKKWFEDRKNNIERQNLI